MSVTIVSTLPKPTQAAATDNAPSGDSTIASADFASLLLGQLAPVVPQVLPETKTQTPSPGTDETSVDAASILASLGLTPNEPGRNANNVSDNRPGKDSALAALNKANTLTPDVMTAPTAINSADTAPKLKLDEKATSALIGADDKPAKFAVPTVVTADENAVILKNIPADNPSNNLSALATNTLAHSSHIPTNRDASLTISTPLRDQNWATDFGQKILWLASNDKQAAQLTLNPPQMGPIEISITMDKGNATASFASANADVREAIETALPRLREMFANAGIQLGQTNVGAESFQQQAANGGANRSASQWMSDNAILGANSAGSLPVRAFGTQHGNGMVDIFA